MRRLSGNTSKVVQFCATLPEPTRVAYEAGPTGYGLARALRATGVDCVVAAPGKMGRVAGGIAAPGHPTLDGDLRDRETRRSTPFEVVGASRSAPQPAD
jgi:hypothetical protein